MAAFDPYPYSPTAGHADLEVISVDRYYDGTVVIRARRRGYDEPTTGWNPPTGELAIGRFLRYAPSITYVSCDLGEIYPPYKPRRSRFKTRFPGDVSAPIPERVHAQAPRARPAPVQRPMHFASPKVWARRNKPTPTRRETNAG